MTWMKLIFLLALALSPPAAQAVDEGAAKPVDLKTFYPEAGALDPAMVREEYREYNRSELYDYINGGAEVYLDLDFVRVGACDYVIELEEETYFTLDIYDMGAPLNAFGIYSAERYGDIPEVKMGVEGYMGGGALNFWSGQYYVKIRADDEGKAINRLLLKMAEYVTGRMGDPGDLPGALRLFPQQDRVKASARYAARNLLGIPKLHGFSYRYERKKTEIILYLCPYEDEKKALEAERQFVDRLKSKPRPDKDGKGFVYEDKYMGRGRVFRIGSFVTFAQNLPVINESTVWVERLVKSFYTAVTEAAMKAKAKRAIAPPTKEQDQSP
jgi:hypothetical protein